ncbi:MAG TPA: ABC transporter permease [Acidimicrobiales bacterium]|nr:ABC transporter permease [Acidimicrobiales bacterium]
MATVVALDRITFDRRVEVVRALARVEIRRSWRWLVVFGVVAGLTVGIAAAAVAAARRTSTAYDRLVERTALEDVRVLTFDGGAFADRIADLDVVDKTWRGAMVTGKLRAEEINYLTVLAGPAEPSELLQLIVVDGRAPSAAEEVVVAEAFSSITGIDVGATLPISLLTREEFTQFDTGFGDPDGPDLDLRVVGVVRLPGDTDQAFNVIAGPSLLDVADPSVRTIDVTGVTLVAGVTADAFEAQLRELQPEYPNPPGGEELGPFQPLRPQADRDAAHQAARVMANGLAALALIALVAGTSTLWQVGRRRGLGRGAARGAERAVGLTTNDQVRVRAVVALLPGIASAVIASAVVVVSSPFTPVGTARSYEPSPGPAVNVAVLVAAIALGLVFPVAIDTLSELSAARASERRVRPPSSVASRLGRAMRSPIDAFGARLALDPGSGRDAVPVRASLLGAFLGVAGLAGATTFGATIDRLQNEPQAWGWTADAVISDAGDDVAEQFIERDDVAGVSVMDVGTAVVGSRGIPTYSFSSRKGAIGWRMIEGRPPAAISEVVVGPKLARQLRAGIGDTIEASGQTFEVVGVGLGFTEAGGGNFNEVMLVTPDALDVIDEEGQFHEVVLAFEDGVDASAMLRELAAQYEVVGPEPPVEVRNIAQLGSLPVVVSGILGLLAVGATAHAATMAARRRRSDFASLQAIGATPGQLRRGVIVMGAVLGATALTLGLPAGVFAGAMVWREVAHGIDVVLGPLVPAALAGSIPLGFVLAMLVAVPAAVAAGRVQPAEVLRNE